MLKNISSRVYIARKRYVCEHCGEYIDKTQHHVHSFDRRDKKVVIVKIHINCIKGWISNDENYQ